MNSRKQIIQNRNVKHHSRKIRYKKKRRNKRRGELKLNRQDRYSNYVRNYKYKSYAKIKAPPKLSIIDNPERTIQFINKIRHKFYLRKPVFVILEEVEIIGYDALVVLLSILIRFKSENIGFNGDFPKNKFANTILVESGFFDYLYLQIAESDRHKIVYQGSTITHAWKKVDSKLTGDLIASATQTIWDDEKRCTGLQKCFIELMHNTNNHADLNNIGGTHWFLSVHHRKKEKKVSFSFIDFGVGIFDSLNSKKHDSKWFDWRSKLVKYFAFDDNSELLRLILEGKLHQTVTGKYYRGKGLPGIYESLKRNQLSNLHIISNDVYADVESNKYLSLSNSLSGTFVYCELDEQNVFLENI